jgi:alpha-tubulin suppressor-like RCC1 family protein
MVHGVAKIHSGGACGRPVAGADGPPLYDVRVTASMMHRLVLGLSALTLLASPLGCDQIKKLSGDSKSESDEDPDEDGDTDKDKDEDKDAKPAASAAAKPAGPALAEIDVGTKHACLRKQDGSVLCWGSTRSALMGAEVGDDVPPRQTKPKPVSGLPKAKQLSIEGEYSCAVTEDGKVHCWGDPPRGLPHGVKPIGTLADVASVSVGERHACAVLSSGALHCWGSGSDGKLGNGGTEDQKLPVAVQGVTDALAAGVGGSHTCVLHKAGTVSCWGANRQGQLGNGSKEPSDTPKPVAGLSNVVALSSNGSLNCALRKDDKVLCWGRNFSGGVGQKKVDDNTKPNEVPGIPPAAHVSVSDDHACISAKDGSVWCWGSGSDGQVAQKYTPSAFKAYPPGKVEGVAGAKMVSATDRATCAITDAGTSAKCWGLATQGRLGNGWVVRHASPVPVAGLDGAKLIAAGREFTCAMMANGSVKCWGGGSGNMAWTNEDNVRERVSAPPVEVRGASESRRLFASGTFVGTQDELGAVQLWFGGVFKLPDQIKGNSEWRPATVDGLSKVASMAAQSRLPFAALASGKLVAFDVDDETKDEQVTRKAATRTVVGFNDVQQIAATTGTRACALSKKGTVTCFSYEHKLGKQPTTPLSAKRIPIKDLKDVAQIAMHSSRGCARHKDGTVSCWRDFNTNDPKPKVEAVEGISGAEQVAVGDTFGDVACAVVTGGKVMYWGSSSFNGLHGSGRFSRQPKPKEVPGISDASSLVMTGEHACVLHKSGKVSCWGNNNDEQLGAKDPPRSFKPVKVAL